MITMHELETNHPPDSLDRDVSPRTRGLALFIQEAVTQLRSPQQENEVSGRDDHDSLLFLGNWHDSHPRLLFHDPILEPVDKVVWAVIRHHADAGDATAFPSYEDIARLANVGSKATVARAIMILRITRWMSLCARVRDDKGRFQGNVYVVHDEPVSIGDAMYLDSEYIRFLHEMETHHHDRVTKVATTALAKIEEAIEAGRDVTQEGTRHGQYEQSLAAVRRGKNLGEPEGFYSVSGQPLEALTISDEDREAVSSQCLDTTDQVQNLNSDIQVQNLNSAGEDRVQNLNSDSKTEQEHPDTTRIQNLNLDSKIEEKQPDTTRVQNLNSADTQVQKLNSADEDRVQNLNSDPEIKEKQADNIQVQNLNSVPVCSSSFFIKTTTTTTTPQEVKPPGAPPCESTGDRLHFPPQFSADELVLARMYLGRIGTAQRQDVLDELQGRLGNARQGGHPIHNPIGYLAQLCNRVETDAFQLTSFGLQVRQAREQAAVREKTEAAKESHHRQVLLAQPPPKSPLVDRLTAIRQQADGRKHGSRSSEGMLQEIRP